MKRALIRPADIIIIVAIIVIAVISILSFTRGDADTVIITQKGEKIATMPLSQNSSRSFGAVTVTVENGTAFVSDSDCPDKICMKTRLKKSGDCAVCLPNQLCITLSGEPETDAVTY